MTIFRYQYYWLLKLSLNSLPFTFLYDFVQQSRVTHSSITLFNFPGLSHHWSAPLPSISLSDFNSMTKQLYVNRNKPILSRINNKVFIKEVTRIAKDTGMIITPAIIDRGYLNMALNFHVTNILKNNLQNHVLYICVDPIACSEAYRYGLPAVMYKTFPTETGDFATEIFVKKAMVKHYVVRDILKMGYSVLLSDLDIFWFRSPVEDLIAACDKKDFVIQNEANINLNIGFMYVNPTKASIDFYDKVIENDRNVTGAQVLFSQLAWKYRNSVKYEVLPTDKYPDGLTYFEKDHRKFPKPCSKCFIAHNNWIVGTEAKEFRFREHLMWFLDKDEYYSSPARKYISYESLPGSTMEDDLAALKSALGVAMAVGRTLILPPYFHTQKKQRTPLNGVLLIRNFEEQFSRFFRESSFLSHPFVPSNITKSICGPFSIQKEEQVMKNTDPYYSSSLNSADWKVAFSDKELQRCSVVKFAFMKDNFKGFTSNSAEVDYQHKLKKGFVRGSYRQLSLLRKKLNTRSRS